MKATTSGLLRDRELNRAGKIALGASCAVCCAVPVLLITGAVTAGAALAAGVVVASLVGVLMLAALVASGRVATTAEPLRRALFAAGGALCFAGLWAARDHRDGAEGVLVVGVALLAASALLVVADLRAAHPRSP